jgi:hypothetical protein
VSFGNLRFFHNPNRILTASKIGRLWTAAHADVAVAVGTGYLGTNCYRGASDSAYMRKVVMGNGEPYFALTCRLWVDSAPAGQKKFMGVTTIDGSFLTHLTVNPDLTVSVWKGSNTLPAGVEVQASAITVVPGMWNRFGMVGRTNQVDGEIEVHMNSGQGQENVILRIDGFDSVGTSDSDWKGVYYGVSPTLFLGHLCAYSSYEPIEGLHGAFVRSYKGQTVGRLDDLAANVGTSVTATDDDDPDDDTTIITGADGDEFSLYMDTLDAAAVTAVRGVQLTSVARNLTDDPVPAFDPLAIIDNGAPVYEQWQQVAQDITTWRAIQHLWQVDPATGQTWTAAKVNAAQFGGRVRA